MKGRTLLGLGLMALAACSDGANSENAANSKGEGAGEAILTGLVYGFTPAPDSQGVALEGARVTLVRLGDLPEPVDTIDSPEPPPPGPDTTLTNRTTVRALLDTVLTPPDTLGNPPPPPPACGSGVEVATVTTGQDGSWIASGLEDGIYKVSVAGPPGSSWKALEYCGYPVSSAREGKLTFYLQL